MVIRPRFSIFTPSHNPRFLDQCLESLCAQTVEDWEWVVVLNGGARWQPTSDDSRIRVVVNDDLSGVGECKAFACSQARGEYLVELDHDDMLVPSALARIGAAFAMDPEASLVYSHCAQVLEDGSRDDSTFSDFAGWRYREVDIEGRRLQHAISFAPSPHNVSYIWYAPNHVRAFRRSAYEEVGGYDPSRMVLDDQELIARLYQAGPFQLVDECLYLQRMHGDNTQRDPEVNAYIQQETVALYDQHFEANTLAWAKREGLLCLDLGAAHNRPDGYLGVDQYVGPDVDIVATLPAPLDLEPNSVGVIRAIDFFEHVADKVGLMNELYRLLAPGGLIISRTPSTDGRGAFQDPTHVAFYNENSFWYLTEENYRRFVPTLHARFQVSRLVTAYPTEWHVAHDIPYVFANLIAVKDGMAPNGGPLLV